MKRIIQSNTLVKISLFLLSFVFLATLFSVIKHNDESETKIQENKYSKTFTPEESSVFKYPVSGIIEAKNSLILRAKTSGTITKIIKNEGAYVYPNDTLIIQSVPLLSSKTNVQNIQNKLSILTQKNALTQSKNNLEQSLVSFNSAKNNFDITSENTLIQDQNTASLLASQVNASVLTLISTLNFIDEYESYFPSNDLKEFKKTVTNLYGEEKIYITGKIYYNIKSHENILKTLKTLTNNTYPDIKKLIEISETVDKELTATKNVLSSAEYKFLDSHTFSTTDTGYTSYLTNRASVLEAQASLRELIGNARSLSLSNDASLLNSKTNYKLSNISSITTNDILNNQNNIYNQTKTLNEAQLSVLNAQRNLGISKAPFRGFVKDVFVDYGEFITAGTPMLSIVGNNAQEIKVTVPKTILHLLDVGDAFISNNKIIGHIDRFAPVLNDGTVVIFISIEDGSYINGDSLCGEIQFLISSKNITSIPREYIHFDTDGAYVVTKNNVQVRVSIIYDSGDAFLVNGKNILSKKLIPSKGISF